MAHPPQLLTLALTLVLAHPAQAALPIVAAERVYGALAQQIAGPTATVQSILTNPAQDPHLFEPDPSTARAIAAARLVIVNGAGYDPWMDRLLAASPSPARIVLRVADLAHASAAANPHLWYAPTTMRLVALAVAQALTRIDPGHATAFAAGLKGVQAELAALDATVATMRTRVAGKAVAATEPLFDPMAKALGLSMRDGRFALASMNGTEPAASDVAAIEADLRAHRVAALIFNAQVSNASAQRLIAVAEEAGVPTVGMTETQPSGVGYAAWMVGQLETLQAALQARP